MRCERGCFGQNSTEITLRLKQASNRPTDLKQIQSHRSTWGNQRQVRITSVIEPSTQLGNCEDESRGNQESHRIFCDYFWLSRLFIIWNPERVQDCGWSHTPKRHRLKKSSSVLSPSRELQRRSTVKRFIAPEKKAKERKLNSNEIRTISETTNDLSERIRLARKALNWTQAELSFQANVSESTISRVENHKTNPQMRTIIKLLKALGAMSFLTVNSCDTSDTPVWLSACGNFSQALRAARRQRVWTQKVLAKCSNLSLRTIKYFENCDCNVRLSSILKIEIALGLNKGVLCVLAAF